MKIAFTFTSSSISYVVLNGTKTSPVFICNGKLNLPTNLSVSQLVVWFEEELNNVLDNEIVDEAMFKLTVNNVSNAYVSNVFYGQAILNLLCEKRKIPITYVAPSSVVVGKFDQPKGTDLHLYLTELIGSHPPFWDKTMRDTALIALLYL